VRKIESIKTGINIDQSKQLDSQEYGEFSRLLLIFLFLSLSLSLSLSLPLTEKVHAAIYLEESATSSYADVFENTSDIFDVHAHALSILFLISFLSERTSDKRIITCTNDYAVMK